MLLVKLLGMVLMLLRLLGAEMLLEFWGWIIETVGSIDHLVLDLSYSMIQSLVVSSIPNCIECLKPILLRRLRRVDGEN